MRNVANSMRMAGMAMAAALGAGGVAPAMADLVTSRAALGGTDHVDWGQYPNGSSFATRPFTSLLGDSGSVTSGAANLLRLTQGSPPNGYWQVNFAPGDAVLLSYSGTITMSFEQAVAGVGAQFAYAFAYGQFDAVMSAYNAAGDLLESHSRRGTTTPGSCSPRPTARRSGPLRPSTVSISSPPPLSSRSPPPGC
jgi:hypothetical protein